MGAKRVLITGASSGLGKEMAVQLARRGWRVAVTGRRADKLAEAARLVREAGGEPLTLQGGVEDLAGVRAHYAELKRAWGGVDWAVLNAGVSGDRRTVFDAEDIDRVFSANLQGAANWIDAVLPDMLAARSGTIAGVASIAGWRGLPRSGPYCASKAALITLLESLRMDVADTGVRVVTVCPGFVKSEMTDRNDPRDMWFMLETPDGAARMIAGIERGARVVHFPWQLSLLVKWLVTPMPAALYEWLAPRLMRRRLLDP